MKYFKDKKTNEIYAFEDTDTEEVISEIEKSNKLDLFSITEEEFDSFEPSYDIFDIKERICESINTNRNKELSIMTFSSNVLGLSHEYRLSLNDRALITEHIVLDSSYDLSYYDDNIIKHNLHNTDQLKRILKDIVKESIRVNTYFDTISNEIKEAESKEALNLVIKKYYPDEPAII